MTSDVVLRINLPTAVRIHTIRHFLEHQSFFPSATPERIVLSFHPKNTRFEPFALAMIAAWGVYWRGRGVEIVCENMRCAGAAYAARLGLFQFIPSSEAPPIEEHEEAGRFVALQHVKKQSDLSKLVGDLGAILRVPELIESAQYLVSVSTHSALGLVTLSGGIAAHSGGQTDTHRRGSVRAIVSAARRFEPEADAADLLAIGPPGSRSRSRQRQGMREWKRGMLSVGAGDIGRRRARRARRRRAR